MGIMVYSLSWVMQDFVHQQYHHELRVVWPHKPQTAQQSLCPLKVVGLYRLEFTVPRPSL